MSVSELNKSINRLRTRLRHCNTYQDMIETLDRINALKDCLIQTLLHEYNTHVVELRAGELDFQCDLSGLNAVDREVFLDMFNV